MKILIAASVQGEGGYEEEQLAMLLEREYRAQGHTVDCFFLPYERNMLSLPDQMLAYQLFRIENCELLITVGYPAAMLKHPNKICYLMQTEPMMFEYWDSAYGVIANYQYSMLHYMLLDNERAAFSEAKRIFCCSSLLCSDLRERYGLDSTCLLYPQLLWAAAEDEILETEPYAVCESSLLPWQRWEELLNVERTYKIFLFVPNSNPIYLESVRRVVEKAGCGRQLQVLERRCTEGELQRSRFVIVPDYQARKITGLVRGALARRKPVAAWEDCGALSQLLPQSNLLPCEQSDRLTIPRLQPAADLPAWLDGAEFAKELLR